MLIIPDYLVKELFDRLMKDREHELFEGEYDAIIGGIRDASSDSEKFEKLFLDLIPLLARYFFNRSGGAWSLSDFPIVPELREEFKKDTITVPVGITDGDLKRIQEEFVDSLSWVALTHEGRGLPETNNHQDIEYDKLPKVLLNDAKVKRLYRNEDYFQVCLLLSLHEIGHLCHHWGNLIKNLTGPNDGTYDPINHIPFIAKSATEVQEEEAWEFCEVILEQFLSCDLITKMQYGEIVGCMEKEITRAAKFKAEIDKNYGRVPPEEEQHRRIDKLHETTPVSIEVYFDGKAKFTNHEKELFLRYIERIYQEQCQDNTKRLEIIKGDTSVHAGKAVSNVR